jgi:hypothetical protein
VIQTARPAAALPTNQLGDEPRRHLGAGVACVSQLSANPSTLAVEKHPRRARKERRVEDGDRHAVQREREDAVPEFDAERIQKTFESARERRRGDPGAAGQR